MWLLLAHSRHLLFGEVSGPTIISRHNGCVLFILLALTQGLPCSPSIISAFLGSPLFCRKSLICYYFSCIFDSQIGVLLRDFQIYLEYLPAFKQMNAHAHTYVHTHTHNQLGLGTLEGKDMGPFFQAPTYR